jgi:hypothetical protein
VPFHVELKDQRDVVRAFNLSEDQVMSRFITPLRTRDRFSIEDKEFESRKARLIVVEGPHLANGELGLGLGWTTARKRGEDVTERFLDAQVGSSPSMGSAGLSADLMSGHRVSERLGVIETVIWEMLHTGQVRGLTLAGEPVPQERWEATVLAESTWLAGGDPVALV